MYLFSSQSHWLVLTVLEEPMLDQLHYSFFSSVVSLFPGNTIFCSSHPTWHESKCVQQWHIARSEADECTADAHPWRSSSSSRSHSCVRELWVRPSHQLPWFRLLQAIKWIWKWTKMKTTSTETRFFSFYIHMCFLIRIQIESVQICPTW